MNRNGWTYKKLSDVSKITMGQSPDGKSLSSDSGMEFHQGKICFGTRLLEKSNVYTSNPTKIANPNSILLCVRAPVGTVNITNRKLCIGRGLCAIEPSDLILLTYLYYALSSKIDYFEKNATGSTFKAISSKVVSNTVIPLPPKDIQQKIVSELDSINETISMLQQQVNDLDALAQSIFYDMFGDPILNDKGWPSKELSEIAAVKTGPFGSMLHKEDYISGGIPLVNPIHMKGHIICPDFDFTISSEKANELSNYLLNKGDIVLARRGDIGRCAVVNKKEEGYLCGTGSLFVRFTESTESKFIMYVVRAKSFTDALIKSAKGATMLNLNSTVVGNLRLILPPLSLQQSFTAKIIAIEDLEAVISVQIDELKYLLASRMQYWFD